MRLQRIRAQLMLRFGIVLAIMSAAVIAALVILAGVNTTVATVAEKHRLQNQAVALALNAQDSALNAISFSLASLNQQAVFAEQVRDFQNGVDSLSAEPGLSGQQIQLLRAIRDVHGNYTRQANSFFQVVLRRRGTGDARTLSALRDNESEAALRVDLLSDTLTQRIAALSAALGREVAAAEGALLQALPRALIVLVIIVTVAGSAAIWIGGRFARWITRPILELSDAADRFTAGNYAARARILATNEISDVANAFNRMAEQIQMLIRSLQSEINAAQGEKARAERADKVKSTFLASMSHELRTPLNAVINFTKFVARGDLGEVNDAQKEALGEVLESSKHLLNLINDVLDMSKIESGSLVLFLEDHVDLPKLVNSAAKVGRSLLTEKPVEVHVEIAPDLPPIRADRQRVYQILLNIVSNACKFTEEGTITIRATCSDGQIMLSVRDTGPGIPLADQPAVFEAFKQTEAGLRQGGGTGLGMPISRSLAEAHGGRLWVESEAGKGATFYVVLPVEARAAASMIA
jgi:signal transduction histidine kinase